MAGDYNGGAAGEHNPCRAWITEAGCCVRVRSDLKAVEVIILVDGNPDSCVLMGPVQAIELAGCLLAASQRVGGLRGFDLSWP
jgi:hypothetical protein